jgi:hypothetical protein
MVVVLVVVLVVVIGPLPTGKSMKFVHSPILTNLTIVVPLGTVATYPANNVGLLTFVANADMNPSVSENRLNGPASVPGVVNRI